MQKIMLTLVFILLLSNYSYSQGNVYDQIASDIEKQQNNEEDIDINGHIEMFLKFLNIYYEAGKIIKELDCNPLGILPKDETWLSLRTRVDTCQRILQIVSGGSNFDCSSCSGTIMIGGMTYDLLNGAVISVITRYGAYELVFNNQQIFVRSDAGYSIMFKASKSFSTFELFRLSSLIALQKGKGIKDVLKEVKDIKYNVVGFSMPISTEKELLSVQGRLRIVDIYKYVDSLYQSKAVAKERVTPVEFAGWAFGNPTEFFAVVKKQFINRAERKE